MAAQPLRRSNRARKLVQSYATEGLLEDSVDNRLEDEQTLVPTQIDEDHDAAQSDFNNTEVKHEHDEAHHCHEHTESHQVLVKTEVSPHDSFISVKEELVAERTLVDHDIDDIQGPAKKKRRTKKETNSGVQLYGYPPEGTMIPWGTTRMRKQPKIFPPAAKKQYTNLSHALTAARRIERRKSDIPRLGFGEEESRLKEYVVASPCS
jgi:hypothetical protein